MNTFILLGVLFCLLMGTGGLFFIWVGIGVLYGKSEALIKIPIISRLRKHEDLTRWIGSIFTANGVLTFAFSLLMLVRPSTGMDLLPVWVGIFVFMLVVTFFGTVQQYLS